MAPRLQWREVALLVPTSEADGIIDEGKQSRATKSQAVNCTICAVPLPHPMRYKLLECTSGKCKQSFPGMKCLWRGKLTICSQTSLASVYQTGDHLTSAVDAPTKALKAYHKQYCRLMASEGLKPLRIRNGLRMKFGIRSEEMPLLSTVQNFVNNYMKTSLDSHHRVDDITAMVRAKIDPSWTNDDNEPVTFTWNYDMDGNAIPGNGTDQVPFIVGVTTKALLRRLDRAPQSFVFHSDATYKLSKTGYPVLVIGISDRCRTFYLVAFCIISQVTENVYTAALAAFHRLYVTLTGKRVQLANVMGDADDGQYNALQTVFGESSPYNFLMCFFHVLLNVNKRLKAVPDITAATIRRDIYNMHFATSQEEFLKLVDASIKRWTVLPDAPGFAAYFSKEWLNTRFVMLQCFWTPPGYATTNNPVEQFNRHLKQHYSLHLKLKTGTLIRLLFQCVTSESVSERMFRDIAEPASTLATRMRELARDKLLLENLDFHYSEGGVVAVVAKPAKRVFVPARKRTEEYLAVTAQFGANFARMETEGQPPIGWPVDVAQRICPCKYWQKFAYCVHLLFAMHHSALVDSMGREVLMDRSVARKRSRGEGTGGQVGRPPRNGPALTVD